MYPEYFLELYSPDDTDAAAPDSNEAPVDDPVEVPVAERAASAAEPKQTNEARKGWGVSKPLVGLGMCCKRTVHDDQMT